MKYAIPLLFLLTRLSVGAQTAASDIPRFDLSACVVGTDKAPDLYWLDLQIDPLTGQEIRNYRPLSIPVGSRGQKVSIPVRPPVRLYTKGTDENGQTTYDTRIEIDEREEGDRMLVIFYKNLQGKGMFSLIDDSAEAHPAGTVRVANKTSATTAVSIGGPGIQIEGNTTQLIGKPVEGDRGRFSFTLAVRFEGYKSYQMPTKRLRFRSPESRLLVIFSFFPEYTSGSNGGSTLSGRKPVAYRIYDQAEIEEPES